MSKPISLVSCADEGNPSAALKKKGSQQSLEKSPLRSSSSAKGEKLAGGPSEKSVAVFRGRSPIRSRVPVTQGSRLSYRMESQRQEVVGNSGNLAAGNHTVKPTQNRVSGIRLPSRLESISRSGVPREDEFKVKETTTLQNGPVSGNMPNKDPPLDPPAFKGEKHSEDGTSGASSSSQRTATSQLSGLGTASSLGQSAAMDVAHQGASCPEASTQPLVQQFRLLSAGKEGGRGVTADTVSKVDLNNTSSSPQNIGQELRASEQFGGADHRNSGETRNSGSRPSAACAGYVLNSYAVAGDAVTTDTRDSISRSRLSAQVLRGILGSSEKRTAGTPGRQSNSARVSGDTAGANNINPLHRTNLVGAASESVGDAEVQQEHSNLDYEQGASFSQSSGNQIDVRADDMGPCGNCADYDGTETYVDEGSFSNRHGEIEWLRTPSLFYFFANVIKWNELQLQRRTLMNSWQAGQQHSNQGSLSLVSVWTQRRERELRMLEAQISFSAFELKGVYLNRLLMSWSKPKLRSLVADVVATWKREGPSSAKFDTVSSRLFDAISSEEACQLRCTWVLSLQQWLGLPRHRWIVAGILIACFVVAILCIVFLAVFGRTHEAVCIALSVVLGVVVILVCVLAMLILHHNTYASAAETYFRQAAVRAAQRTMEEEELEDVNDLSTIDSYLGSNEMKCGGTPGRGIGSVTNNDDNETETRSDYTEEQISLAIRNLRALTEGTPQPAGTGTSYYRIPSNGQDGRQESGTVACGYHDDDMTLTDDNVPSLTSRPLQIGDAAKQKQDHDRDKTPRLGTVTYEQHQEYLQQQSLLVQETVSSSKARNSRVGGPREDHFAGHVEAAAHVGGDGGGDGSRDNVKRDDRCADAPRGLRQLADLPDKVNITALLYCSNAGVLSEVAPSLWARMFMLFSVTELRALDNAFKHGSDRFKVILIYALDAPDGSEVLRSALTWLQAERRPVFFIGRQGDVYAHQVPLSARLKVPFTTAAMNTLLLAGIGVDAELGSISFPALVQQVQSSSQPFQVPPYVLGRRLGGGAFGNVFEAEMEQSGAKCAVKRMYLKEESDNGDSPGVHGGHSSVTASTSAKGESKMMLSEVNHTINSGTGGGDGESASSPDGDGGTTAGVGSQLREIAQEVEIMSSLQHPNIVRYYFCERDDNCISIFMELCTGGSLSSLIHSGKLVQPPEIKLLLREIVSAVAYLHSLRIVHRDLKPDNVLFRQGHAKITDFGTAVHKHGGDLRLIKGTFAYMAPETLVGEPYGSACDVWSIGCIAAEVLDVELPQHALGLPAMCEFYRTMPKDSTLVINCDVPGVRDFLLACLSRDPAKRCTAAELFYHPILQARDVSIGTWMQKVVEQRRHKHILQHKMSHRIGPGVRGNSDNNENGTGSMHTGANSRHDSKVDSVTGGDIFDLNSGNGSIISLDSSRLTGHEDN